VNHKEDGEFRLMDAVELLSLLAAILLLMRYILR
jgi:hypothetical protein